MKIKILVECDPQSLEKICNEFIANKHVINIQFKINNYPDYFAFVTYEDKQHVRLVFCSSILNSARDIDFVHGEFMRVNFTIEGPPIGKARPRVTRTVTYTPAKTARYEDLVRYTAINSFKGIFDKDEPLDVKIIAYFEIPKSLSKKRKALCLANQELPTKKPDADNIAKIIMDGMNPKMKRDKRLHKMVEVMRGVYHDDKQVTTLLVKKRYAERARVDVRIKRDIGDQNE